MTLSSVSFSVLMTNFSLLILHFFVGAGEDSFSIDVGCNSLSLFFLVGVVEEDDDGVGDGDVPDP